ncbi:MAG: DNA-binding response regulator [Chloroflexi bacterium RBG_16_56_8]|nr:MAG: DNA-binding response regulator [Chloroflexi bacterium RBG_16_56_8]
MPNPIRILLADDHVMLRQGTVALLRRERDMQVVAEASNGQEAVELACKLKPDIVVMDVRMPVLTGVEATRRIRELVPNVQVLVLTAHDDDQYVFSLLEAGASGYLLKTAPVSDLVKAIRQVREGESPLDPAIARKVVLHMSGQRPTTGVVVDRAPPAEELTARELEVLRLLAQGLNNSAIAETLSISDRTVQAHLTNIFAKMHVTSRLEAVLAGIRRGWLSLES